MKNWQGQEHQEIAFLSDAECLPWPVWHPEICPQGRNLLIFPFGLSTETVLGDTNPGLIIFSQMPVSSFLETNS